MNVDLNNTSEYDKSVIYLDSRNSRSNNDTYFEFYINFNEPLKNVFAIKLENINVVSNVLGSLQDLYFVQINDYERSTSYINDGDNFNIVKYYDAVPYKGTLYNGGVYSANITNGGNNYMKGATVTFTASPSGITAEGYVEANSAGKITKIIITNIGSGYISVPTMTVTVGSGFLGTSTIAQDQTYVSEVTITNGGSNYMNGALAIFTAAPEGGVTAEGYVETNASGVVTRIIITKRGSGYLEAPTVTIATASGFAGTSIINNYISGVSHMTSATNFSDPTTYLLNPPEPNLNRFQISIRDKNFKKISKSDINYINLTICVYNIKKNVLYK
jgi:hypothetical protein